MSPPHTAAAAGTCTPLWTDGSSDATVSNGGQQDQLDIVGGAMADDGTALTTTLTLKNLSTTVPVSATANEYYMVFTVGPTTYFTNAEVSAAGVFYSYGTASGTGFNGAGSAAGTFVVGPGGRVTVTVPFTSVGKPSVTNPVTGINGETDVLTGAPTVGGGNTTVDSDQVAAGYTIGSCSSVAPPTGSGLPVTTGPQAFANYGAPPTFQNRDALLRPNAGEPSIGADWATGRLMLMAGTQVSQISFDTSKQPPAATWVDVTPAQLANASEDSILYTDSATNRTWAEDFLVNPTCNANMAYSDGDGGSGGTASNSSWVPEQCPYAVGPDHPSIGAGPYHGAPPPTATYRHIVYYCSQNIVNIGGAECTHSENGGLTWDPPAHIFGTGTPCFAIHGHIRVSPDGTMYVPQDHCGTGQGMAITQDNGSTYTYAVVPDSTPGLTDPSVAADAANTVYFGYEDGSGHPQIAVSHDHGNNWSPSADVGTPFGITNSKFPEVIAGDAGRAAFAFLGTSCPATLAGCKSGDQKPADQKPGFPGAWYLYVSYTYDGGRTWQTVNATPGDPVQRGCIWNGGGAVPCRNLLDFNDITVDKAGHVYVAYTDGCTVDPSNTYNCDTTAAIDDSGCNTTGNNIVVSYSENASEYSTATCTYGRQSAVVRQVCGRGLFAAADPGFSEGPSCLAVAVPEARSTTVLLLTGAAGALFSAVTLRRRRRACLS